MATIQEFSDFVVDYYSKDKYLEYEYDEKFNIAKTKLRNSRNGSKKNKPLHSNEKSIKYEIKHSIIKSQRKIERDEKLEGSDCLYYCSKCYNIDCKPCDCDMLSWCGINPNSSECEYQCFCSSSIFICSCLCEYHEYYLACRSRDQSSNESSDQTSNQFKELKNLDLKYPSKAYIMKKYYPYNRRQIYLETITE